MVGMLAFRLQSGTNWVPRFRMQVGVTHMWDMVGIDPFC